MPWLPPNELKIEVEGATIMAKGQVRSTKEARKPKKKAVQKIRAGLGSKK